MLTYHYVARNPQTGEKISADVQADSEQAAAKLLQQEGLAPLEIKLNAAKKSGFFGKFKNRITTKDKILFSRQLSTLINAGLPLVQSLRNVGHQTQNKAFQEVINKVIGSVEGGNSFSSSLAKHPDVFNRVYTSLIAAGETSGTLDKALERLAFQQEKEADLISKVRGAMVYPLVVIVVMIAVVGFMVLQVLPQVGTLYDELGGSAQLPILTRALLALSEFVIEYWWVFLIIFVVATFATTKWARTLGGKRYIDWAKLHVPPTSGLFQKMYMARFARTANTLVASGVPLIQVLDVTASSVNNLHIEESIHNATDKVKGGQSLADALRNEPNFLELVPDMIKIGEQSGSVEAMLEKTADYYDKEVDNQVKTITTVIEPVLMIFLGVFAFIIVAAVLMPIYGLAGENIAL
jgi:type IV pilus assembly protein PilC